MADATKTTVRTLRPRHRLLLIAVGVAVVATCFLPRMAQDQAYHDFADKRAIFGIPNALDVLSNIPFVLVGAWGLVVALRGRASPDCSRPSTFVHPWDFWPYAALFLGTLLTGFGSGWYHLAPDNHRLVWDRLPMTIGFMGLLVAIVSERVSLRAAKVLLGPLLAFGAASVLYWDWTERQGHGDLRPYALVQFGSMLLLVMILLLYPTPRRGTGWLVAALAAYVAAKVFEALDRPVLAMGELVSGHSLKHVFAALAVGLIGWMLRERRREGFKEWESLGETGTGNQRGN